MKINKGYIVAGLLIACLLFFELAAHADTWDQATKLTFTESVQIPGQILPAGSYLIEMVNTDTNRNIVQIFNSDRTVLYATLQTVPTERLKPTGDAVITFAEESGRPVALVKWFYPGNIIGNEFLYSKQEEKELAQDKLQVITVHRQTVSNSNATAVGD